VEAENSKTIFVQMKVQITGNTTLPEE